MEEEKVCPGCCHKTKERSEKEYKDLLTLNLKTGISFPKARAKALDEYFKNGRK